MGMGAIAMSNLIGSALGATGDDAASLNPLKPRKPHFPAKPSASSISS